MQTFINILNLTCIATAPVAAHQLVGFDDAPTGADDVPVKAVALNPADTGEAFNGLGLGTVQVIASGVIAKGDKLISAAAGKVKTAGADPANVFASALTAAADGELVEILVR